MQLLISDANILIDIEEGQLVDQLFKLPYQLCVPDILFVEELEEQHRYLLDKGLQLKELSSVSVQYAIQLTEKYVRPSRNDCLSLALAKQEQCPLLTGDRALKDAAKSENIDCMGTLWLARQMIIHKLVDISELKLAFERMFQMGRRLPRDKVDALLQEIDN